MRRQSLKYRSNMLSFNSLEDRRLLSGFDFDYETPSPKSPPVLISSMRLDLHGDLKLSDSIYQEFDDKSLLLSANRNHEDKIIGKTVFSDLLEMRTDLLIFSPTVILMNPSSQSTPAASPAIQKPTLIKSMSVSSSEPSDSFDAGHPWTPNISGSQSPNARIQLSTLPFNPARQVTKLVVESANTVGLPDSLTIAHPITSAKEPANVSNPSLDIASLDNSDHIVTGQSSNLDSASTSSFSNWAMFRNWLSGGSDSQQPSDHLQTSSNKADPSTISPSIPKNLTGALRAQIETLTTLNLSYSAADSSYRDGTAVDSQLLNETRLEDQSATIQSLVDSILADLQPVDWSGGPSKQVTTAILSIAAASMMVVEVARRKNLDSTTYQSRTSSIFGPEHKFKPECQDQESLA